MDGILLGQCKLAGFRQYGDGLMQGVRVLELNEDAPEHFTTYMRYYRELIGSDCESIHGSLKCLRDRTSIKLEAGLKTLGCAAAAGTAVYAGLKFAKFIKNR